MRINALKHCTEWAFRIGSSSLICLISIPCPTRVPLFFLGCVCVFKLVSTADHFLGYRLCGFLCRFSEIVCYSLLSEREGLEPESPSWFCVCVPCCTLQHPPPVHSHPPVCPTTLHCDTFLPGYAPSSHSSHLHALPHSTAANSCLDILVVHGGGHLFTRLPLACLQAS